MNNATDKMHCSFEHGFEKGYEQAMVECSGGLEEAYLDGYKDCLCGEAPMVEDEELREVLKKEPAAHKGCSVNNDAEKIVDGDLYVSGKILCMVEDVKKRLFEVRKQIYSSAINQEEQRTLALKLFKVTDLLDKVQHQYTSDEMYRFLGYLE